MQVRREERLAERDRLGRAGRVETVRAPRLLAAFDDERAQIAIEAIGVHGEPAVFGALENEGERVERQRRAEPDIAAKPPVEIRPKGRA